MDAPSLTEVALIFLMLLMQKDETGFTDSVKTIGETELLDEYDIIIVGSGSAGSTLAGRLSEVKEWKILLLEAGEHETAFTKTPAMMGQLMNSKYDWNYTAALGGRNKNGYNPVSSYARGRALGGSSSINGMVYTRGYRWDYDRWGKDNAGWSFKDVEPYFLKAEGNRIPGLKNRGRNGPLTVDFSPYRTQLSDMIIKAGEAKGLRNADCSDYENDCILRAQTTIRDGRRCSASTAYLEPVSATRNNLHILTNALVSKVIIENKVAKGVEFSHGGKKLSVKAKKEVIVSAGTVNSPKILMLSGIGIKSHLESLNIPVIVDLPVGDNFQDQSGISILYKVQKGSVPNVLNYADKSSMEQYIANQTGPYSHPITEIQAYIKRGTRMGQEPPNVQYHFLTAVGLKEYLVSVLIAVIRPQTIGTIRLSSSDPTVAPLIDFNYFGTPQDRQLKLEGMQFAHEMFQKEPLASQGASLYKDETPECATETEPTKYFNCMLEYNADVLLHPVGTVKMGPKNKKGVVNTDLQVYGVKNLRVIDASIGPSVISMNTNAMAIMIGEKGADIVKTAYGQVQQKGSD